MKKEPKQNIFYYLIYAVFYIVYKWTYYIGYLGYLLMSLLSAILPNKLQTKTMLDKEFRESLIKDRHEWGLPIYYTSNFMVGFRFFQCSFIIVFLSCKIADFGLNQKAAFIAVAIIFGILIIKNNESLYSENKYQDYFKKFDKNGFLWKVAWHLITLVYVVGSFSLSFYIIRLILTKE